MVYSLAEVKHDLMARLFLHPCMQCWWGYEWVGLSCSCLPDVSHGYEPFANVGVCSSSSA